MDRDLSDIAPWFGMVAILIILFVLAVSGCASVEHKITAPQLDRLAQCPRLDLPPIPDELHLNIVGKDLTGTDAAGKRLLLGYSAAYSLFRAVK